MNSHTSRNILYSLAILVVVSCEEPEKAVLPGLPMNVKSIALRKSPFTNSETLIANGVNTIQFEIKYLDEKQVPVGGIYSRFVQVWVNDEWELKPPYRFSTTDPGTYNFSFRTVEGKAFSEYEGTVIAISPPQLISYRLPVIIHHFDPDVWPLVSRERQDIVKFFTDSLAAVNEAFANGRRSKDPNAIDAKIEFYLATENPEGQTLEYPGFEFSQAPGLTREWESLFSNAKEHYWPPSRYINVWIVTLDGWGGYAFYPEYEATESAYPTGVYGTFIERSNRSIGITLAHEFAHMLDVWHVFGFDCNYSDMCDDTHAYTRDKEDVHKSQMMLRSSCDLQPFLATNIMDYRMTDNTTFTHDQILRMHHALQFSPFLPTPDNDPNGRKAVRPPVHLASGIEKLVID